MTAKVKNRWLTLGAVQGIIPPVSTVLGLL